MSINNATPADWDRLRKQHPPLEVPKPTIAESMKQTYIDLAQEEFHSEMIKTEWYQQQVERKKLEEFNERWGNVEGGDVYTFDDDEEDAVNSPNHYNNGSVECIEGIQASMSDEAFAGYLKGNCMKYLWRYDYKGKPVEDLQKAQWYLAKLLNVVVFEEGEE